MIRIPNIKCPVGADIKEIVRKKTGGFSEFKIIKKSIDARRKNDVHFVYTVAISASNEQYLLKKIQGASIYTRHPYHFPAPCSSDKTILIAGTGPAGLMCGLTLAKNGYKVIMLERGKDVDSRLSDVEKFWNGGELDPDSNVQFGEGGAGTFSDGKLNTGTNDFRIHHVLEEFVKHGAPEEILYNSKPHVGTDNLSNMVRSIRKHIVKLGGEVRFSTRADKILIQNGAVTGVEVTDIPSQSQYSIPAQNLVLAIGHSARDTFVMLKNAGVDMEAKSFSVGVRIEHPQSLINKAQYGEFAKYLGAADYKLSAHLPNGRGVYTFCMCPGGNVVASASEKGGIVTNGMSFFARNGKNANSAVLVNVTPEDFGTDDVLGGMYFQRQIEQNAFAVSGSYKAPAQRCGEFLGIKNNICEYVTPTYRPGVVWCDLSKIFPKFVTDSLKSGIHEMDKRLHGFACHQAVLTAPETRSSSPVRILRDLSFQSNIKGLYPCGEGAGYAGGIISAAVDGIKTAEKIALNISNTN